MALINCKECGHQVSSKAEACPGCGARIMGQSPKRMIGRFVLLFITAVVALVIIKALSPRQSTSVDELQRKVDEFNQGQ